MKFLQILVLGVFATISAQAHYIWIELKGEKAVGQTQEVRIYYGEFNEGVREVKGGRLEEVAGIESWIITPSGKRVPLNIAIDASYYRATFQALEKGIYRVVAVNVTRDVVDWSKHKIGIVRPVYYTSREVMIGSSETSTDNSELPQLSIVSTDKQNNYQVLFNNQPVANAKVLFHAPNEWSKELQTNQDGKVAFTPLWKGQYIIECILPEEVPGNFRGKNYEAIRHRSTLAIDIQ
jgi:uncharacterized GH25 family protein